MSYGGQLYRRCNTRMMRDRQVTRRARVKLMRREARAEERVWGITWCDDYDYELWRDAQGYELREMKGSLICDRERVAGQLEASRLAAVWHEERKRE